MNVQESLAKAPYVSLATFRKSGAKVATPVWCAPVGDWLYVFSAADAGKVKRLRNSDQAELATCDMRGKVLGDRFSAQAEITEDPDEIREALKALRAKYGWQMRLADFGSRMTGRFDQRAYIRVRINSLGQG